MKTLAKYHVCYHCVIGEKTFKNILTSPVSYRDFRETGPGSDNCYMYTVAINRNFVNLIFN